MFPPGRLAAWLRNTVPLLLYGLRLWAAVCLALFVAFRLELQNPFRAGTTPLFASRSWAPRCARAGSG